MVRCMASPPLFRPVRRGCHKVVRPPYPLAPLGFPGVGGFSLFIVNNFFFNLPSKTGDYPKESEGVGVEQGAVVPA